MLIEYFPNHISSCNYFWWCDGTVVWDDCWTEDNTFWLVPGTFDDEGRCLPWVTELVLFGGKANG